MIRLALGLVALTLLGLFGYFFVTAPEQQGGTERARHAAVQVGDAVVDQGVAGLVRARLASGLGLEAARFLHVHRGGGQVLIYGLLPSSASAEELADLAREVPGVSTVDVQVMPRPAYLAAPPRSATGESDGGG